MALAALLILQDPKLVDAFLKARDSRGFDYAAARDQVVGFGETAIPYLESKLEDRSWETRVLASAMLARLRDPKRHLLNEATFAELAHPDTFDEKRAGRPHYALEDVPFLQEQFLKAQGRPVPSAKRGERVETRDHRTAFEELGAFKDLAVVEPMLAALEEETEWTEEVARLLAGCGEAAIPKLRPMARAGTPAIRTIALEALGARPWEEVRDDLTWAAGDRDAWIRSTAAAQLARSASPEARTVLETMLLKDKDTYVRSAAADAIRAMGPKESVGALIDALKDPTLTVTAAATRALCEAADEKARTPLREQLQSFRAPEAASIREWSLRALGRLGWDGDASLISEFLADSVPEVRVAAVRALAQTDPARREILVEVLKQDKEEAVRLEAVAVLATAEGAAALAGVLGVESSPAVKLKILDALKTLKAAETEPAVVRCLGRDPSWKVRRAAAQAAAALGSYESLKVAAKNDAHEKVRATAAELLKEAGRD